MKEPLRDLSVSRTKFKWGVPVPNDEKHVMYVLRSRDIYLCIYLSVYILDEGALARPLRQPHQVQVGDSSPKRRETRHVSTSI